MPISPSTMSLIVMRSFHRKQALAKNTALPVMPEIRDCGSKLAEIPVSNLNLLRTVSGYSKRRRRATVQLMEKTMRSLLSITAIAIAFALRCMRAAEADLNYTEFSGEQSAKHTSWKLKGRDPCQRESTHPSIQPNSACGVRLLKENHPNCSSESAASSLDHGEARMLPLPASRILHSTSKTTSLKKQPKC